MQLMQEKLFIVVDAEMATVIRLKRKHSEVLKETLLVSGKRTRHDGLVEGIFHYIGTADAKSGEAVHDVIKNGIEQLKQDRTQLADVKSKLRKRKTSTTASPYELVGKQRNIVDGAKGIDGDSAGNDLRVIELAPGAKASQTPTSRSYKYSDELERCLQSKSVLTCNDIPAQRTDVTEEEEAVYDLYYTSEDAFRLTDPGQIHQWNIDSVDELLPADEDDDQPADDEDDSNDEDNWRNDYPDEVSGDEQEEEDEDLLLEMAMMSVEDDERRAAEDSDEDDLHQYMSRYEEYKSRMMREMKSKGLYPGSPPDGPDSDDADGHSDKLRADLEEENYGFT